MQVGPGIYFYSCSSTTAARASKDGVPGPCLGSPLYGLEAWSPDPHAAPTVAAVQNVVENSKAFNLKHRTLRCCGLLDSENFDLVFAFKRKR